MATITPTINRIIRITEFDLLRTANTVGNMYICLDTLRMYYDQTTAPEGRVEYSYTGVKTVNELLKEITPVLNNVYYCWEDNSLWLWLNRWVSLYSETTYPSAYSYPSTPTTSNRQPLVEVYRYDQPSAPADDNGLLHDGSVIVRDRQRLIKGKLYINDDNDNLVITSFLGGGIRLLPNGATDSVGELLLDADGDSRLRSKFTVLNNELYVDYTEHPEEDNNDYATSSHIYKVFHEGNLDASAIKILTPEEIYNKLLDPSLPNEFAFNVRQIGGATIDELASAQHNHYASDILDFNEQTIAQSKIAARDILTTADTEGIDISYITAQSKFKFSANSFNITLGGGVTGTALVDHLSDVTIDVTVDPTKHIHTNYVTKLEDLQVQINNINAMDPEDYYTKTVTDQKLSAISGTTTPTADRPLLVNSDLILPATAQASTQFSTSKTINYVGDITGTLTTDFSTSSVDVTLDTSNILSDTATSGKALKLNSNLDLPANATSSTKLNHTITITLGNQLSGSVEIDTEQDTALLNAILVPGPNILQESDLGSRVATLGSDGKVPSSQLPSSQSGLVPMGVFDPNDGYPSSTPTDGQFWIADSQGVLDGVIYNIDDWCVYLQSTWTHIATSSLVSSVNGYTGNVTLTHSDVGAISLDYIDYTLGNTIPTNHIVRTSGNGVITGATVRSLTNSFTILTDASTDIAIDANSSAPSTDGSSDIGLLLKVTPTGYTNIKNEIVPIIKTEGVDLGIPNSINFTNGISAIMDGNNNVTISGGSYSDTSTLIVHSTDTFLDKLLELYNNRNTQAVDVIYIDDNTNQVTNYLIDSSYPDVTPGATITVTPVSTKTEIELNTSTGVNEIKEYNYFMSISVNNDGNISSVSQVKTLSSVTGRYLDSGTRANTTIFLPSQPYQPATKEYVDNQVGTKQNTLTAGYNIQIQNNTISSTARAIMELEGTLIDPVLGYNMVSGLYDVTGYYGILNAIDNNTSHVLWYVSETEVVNNIESKTILELNPDSIKTYKLYKDGTTWKLRDTDSEVVTKSMLEAQTAKTVTQSIGNGTATSFTITHNLNTRNVLVQIYDNSTYQEVIADVYRTTANAIRVDFATVPTTNQYTVVIK